MKHSQTILAIALILFTGIAPAAVVEADAYGAQVSINFGLGTAGGGGAGMSEVSAEDANMSASAEVILEADDGLPTIRVRAAALFGDASAFGAGLQKYEYTGTQTADVTVFGNAHGFLTGDSLARARLRVFRDNEDELQISETELGEVFTSGAITGYFNESIFPESDSGFFSQNAGDAVEFNLPLSVTVAMNPNDVFWVYASFFVFADEPGAVADGSTTAVFDFDTTDVNIIGSTVVPLPGALVLMLGALGLLSASGLKKYRAVI